MNSRMKSILKAMTTKKALVGMFLLGAPIVGIAVSPEFASSFAEHLSGMLQMVIDALPSEATDAAVDAASGVPE